MNKYYCWYCDTHTKRKPDHFNKNGECVAQLEAHKVERLELWKEIERESKACVDINADMENKRRKENPRMPSIDLRTGRDIY